MNIKMSEIKVEHEDEASILSDQWLHDSVQQGECNEKVEKPKKFRVKCEAWNSDTDEDIDETHESDLIDQERQKMIQQKGLTASNLVSKNSLKNTTKKRTGKPAWKTAMEHFLQRWKICANTSVRNAKKYS